MDYDEASSRPITANGGQRRWGHGDGTQWWNTGDVVRGETAYRALLASKCGRGGAVGSWRSCCGGDRVTMHALGTAMATAARSRCFGCCGATGRRRGAREMEM